MKKFGDNTIVVYDYIIYNSDGTSTTFLKTDTTQSLKVDTEQDIGRHPDMDDAPIAKEIVDGFIHKASEEFNNDCDDTPSRILNKPSKQVDVNIKKIIDETLEVCVGDTDTVVKHENVEFFKTLKTVEEVTYNTDTTQSLNVDTKQDIDKCPDNNDTIILKEAVDDYMNKTFEEINGGRDIDENYNNGLKFLRKINYVKNKDKSDPSVVFDEQQAYRDCKNRLEAIYKVECDKKRNEETHKHTNLSECDNDITVPDITDKLHIERKLTKALFEVVDILRLRK